MLTSSARRPAMKWTWCARRQLRDDSGAALNICVAAALRRGVTDAQEAARLQLAASNLQPGFTLSGALAEAALSCDRLVQF